MEEEKEEFSCQICLEAFDEDGSDDQTLPFCLQDCDNIFHAGCLVEYLETAIKENKLPIRCPDVRCKEEVADADLKELLSEESYLKYSNFALNNAVA